MDAALESKLECSSGGNGGGGGDNPSVNYDCASHPPVPQFVRFCAHGRTKIMLVQKSRDDLSCSDNDRGSGSSSGGSSVLHKLRSRFGGYEECVPEALVQMRLGLYPQLLMGMAVPAAAAPCSIAAETQRAMMMSAAVLTRPPRGMIIYGPPGTGKTTLMHAMIAVLGCNYIEIPHTILLSRCAVLLFLFKFHTLRAMHTPPKLQPH